MDRVKLAHVLASWVKGLSLVLGLSAFAHFLPAAYAGYAIAVFAATSWLKDLITATETKLESSEPITDIAVETAQAVIAEAGSVAKPAPVAQPVKSANHPK